MSSNPYQVMKKALEALETDDWQKKLQASIDLRKSLDLYESQLPAESYQSNAEILVSPESLDKQMEEINRRREILEAYEEELRDWVKEGESIMASAGIAFKFGVFWASRPWKKK